MVPWNSTRTKVRPTAWLASSRTDRYLPMLISGALLRPRFNSGSPFFLTSGINSSNYISPVYALSVSRVKSCNACYSPSLAVQRLRMLQEKKEALAKASRRDIATLVERGRIETARVKVEAIIGDDIHVELLELLELYCELLLARFGLLELKYVPHFLLEFLNDSI